MKTCLLFCGLILSSSFADPLPSWNGNPTKKAIIEFVEKVTTPGSPDYVDPSARIATFDNDGCLWSEQPVYFQALYIFDRIKALAPQHPDWKEKEPFASAINGEIKSALAGGEHALIEMTMATHADMTSEEFRKQVSDWIDTARHPQTKKSYHAMVFQPMLELLAYLRAEGFKTFIVSGGGIDFVRVFAEDVYGIPPEQVIGSSIQAKYELRNGKPVIVKIPELNFVDDKAGKPVGIHQHIGRRPIFAAGNSDGDFQMLEWTTTGGGARFAMLIHHDDADREFAYDRKSDVGLLSKGLDEGPKRGWTIVSMKHDWNRIYPAQN
ncbi:MAG: HAD family hydrolase [Luteolibacter sp.]